METETEAGAHLIYRTTSSESLFLGGEGVGLNFQMKGLPECLWGGGG